ncbi:MAG: stage 0 sporulation protein, partial [Clostridia bacterium]|nr:stage 0 sporulation protein [Clostridia bacterium]
MAKIVVGIKFNHTGKVYYFDPEGKNYRLGCGVVVETARGVEYGKVVIEKKEVAEENLVQPLKPITRIANADDEARVENNEARVPSAIKTANEKAQARGLDMKFIDAEFTFDGSKILFYFTSAQRVDFRELVKDLAAAFHMRIELRQVGIRDETKCIGGIAPCGRECCCSSGVCDFKKVSIKMAKTQGLSLNPTKISGLCGRLMCCLEFENNHYCETYKKMPKIGSEVG